MTDRGPPRTIVALDFEDAATALAFAKKIDPTQCRLKIGIELFSAAGPALVERLTGEGYAVFLDLKFHDIPNTVARACTAAAKLGVWMLNVHVLGGTRMLQAARAAIDSGNHRPLLVGVTLLTSHTAEDIQYLGMNDSIEAHVVKLAGLAHTAGFDGVVCSPREAAAVRAAYGREFLLVTPGIRMESSGDDQRRTLTPQEARRQGADYLVIGRPITRATDPGAALAAVVQQIVD